MIRGFCSVCGRAFKVDDRFAGMTGRCKSCGVRGQIMRKSQSEHFAFCGRMG